MQAPEKIKQLIDLLQDKEVQSFLKLFIDNSIVTSDLNILKRLSTIESMLGLNCDYEEEDHAPTLPEKISRLEEITSQLNKAENPDLIDKSLVPPSKNITEIRADYLADYMRTNQLIPKAPAVFANIEVKVMDSNEFRYFVNHILPPEYRPESTKNLRKMKKDVFETAAKRHKSIDTDKADHGRNELRLLYFREKTMEEMQPLLNSIHGQPSLTATV